MSTVLCVSALTRYARGVGSCLSCELSKTMLSFWNGATAPYSCEAFCTGLTNVPKYMSLAERTAPKTYIWLTIGLYPAGQLPAASGATCGWPIARKQSSTFALAIFVVVRPPVETRGGVLGASALM